MTHPFINLFSYDLYGSTWVAKCIKTPLSLAGRLWHSLAQQRSNYDKRREWFCSAPKKACLSLCWQRHYSVGWSIVFVSCASVCLFFCFRASSVSTNDGFRHRLCLITLWARCLWIYDVIGKRGSHCNARSSPSQTFPSRFTSFGTQVGRHPGEKRGRRWCWNRGWDLIWL